MKRFPPYMIVAVCGILFLSAGMVIITADSSDPSALPTATLDVPTPTEIVSVPVVQPTDIVQPVVQPTDVPPPVEVQPVVQPTDVVIPAEVVQPVQPTAVVDQAQVAPVGQIQGESVQQQAAPVVVGGQVETQPTPIFEIPVTAIPADAGGTVLTPVIQQPNGSLGTLPPPSNVMATAENPVVIPNVVVATAQPNVQTIPTLALTTQVAGQIAAPFRADASGIAVMLTMPDGSGVQTTTDSAGNFVFANLISGAYHVDAGAVGYLSSQTAFTLTQGQTLVLPSVMLVGGDTNQDNKIDLTDAALIAANFDSTSIVAGADLNHDGIVDIRDLTTIGAYFGQSGPTPWNP